MKLIKKIACITAVIVLLAVFWPGKAYAEGGAYVSDTYLEIELGDTVYISIGTDNAAGTYSVTSYGSVMANDSGWVDDDSPVTIGIYAASVGDGSVTIEFPDLATYDEEDRSGTEFTVTVYVYEPDGGYDGDYGKGGNEEPQDPEPVVEQPTEKLGVWVDDQPYSVMTDLSEVEIPKGFTVTDGTYDGEAVKTLTCGNDIVLYALWNHWDGSIIYRTYDQASKSFKEPDAIRQGNNTYYLLKIPEGTEIPEQYQEKEVSINGTNVTALIDGTEGYEDFCYIYAMNNGNKGFYSYDQKEGSLQRVVSLRQKQENKEEPAKTQVKKASVTSSKKIFLIALGIAIIIIIVLFIMLLSARRRARELEDDDY
ncbi:MAG: hypothetical protein IKZ95_07085 [Lachnospiraceae bacterium]|nr:hypothetical protein [Lachnospiraceae bacterium]